MTVADIILCYGQTVLWQHSGNIISACTVHTLYMYMYVNYYINSNGHVNNAAMHSDS